MSRTVIVASPSSSVAKKITDFNGSTWGELKNHPTVRGLLVSGLEAILNPGNVTLNMEDAQLPEGDFRVFLVATKNKAGAISPSDASNIANQIADAILKASRLADEDAVNNLKDELIETVEGYFGVDLEEDDCEGCSDALAAAQRIQANL